MKRINTSGLFYFVRVKSYACPLKYGRQTAWPVFAVIEVSIRLGTFFGGY
jgi:hypothetical protein